jgi:hypothetical protein
MENKKVKEAPVQEVQAPVQEPQAPAVDPNQQVETNAYVPTYKVKPEFKDAVLKAIGQAPFNQIAGIVNAINVEVMDHNTLTQVINVLGNFPYTQVAGILTNVNAYVEQIVEE